MRAQERHVRKDGGGGHGRREAATRKGKRAAQGRTDWQRLERMRLATRCPLQLPCKRPGSFPRTSTSTPYYLRYLYGVRSSSNRSGTRTPCSWLVLVLYKPRLRVRSKVGEISNTWTGALVGWTSRDQCSHEVKSARPFQSDSLRVSGTKAILESLAPSRVSS